MDSSSHSEASTCPSTPATRPVVDTKVDPVAGLESGYVSGASSASGSTLSLPLVTLTKPHVRHLNQQLERLSAVDRLKFVQVMFPNLYQSTAFGLSGLVTIDMLSKIHAENPDFPSIDLIFLDTLYHFQETLDLVDRVKAKYPSNHIHIYRPEGANTSSEFEERYGEKVYETASELYDWVAKVEPLQRAYSDLNVAAVLTGRRRSQGGQRDKIGVIEVDEETGIIKINPLVDWSFQQVKAYIDEHNVSYNALLDRGYKSVGDWHSTSPVKEGEDERAGRWKGQEKTECGIHNKNKKSRYALYLEEQARILEEQARKEEQEKAAREQQQLMGALAKVERERQIETAVGDIVIV